MFALVLFCLTISVTCFVSIYFCMINLFEELMKSLVFISNKVELCESKLNLLDTWWHIVSQICL